MRSRLPLIASVLLSGTGLAACQLALGIDGLTSGTGGSASSTSSTKPSTSTSSTGAGASSSSQTTSSTSGGGSNPSATSTTTSTTSSSGAPDSGFHTCTPLVGGYPDETCTGLFVSSSLGSDAGTADGTMANPYPTIGEALAAATNANVTLYVCAETFTEPVTSDASVTMYGGLDCHKGWQYTSSQTTLNGLADSPAVTFMGASTVIENFAINGAATTTPGGSSIGMAFGGAILTLNNVGIAAASGVPGAAGASPGARASDGSQGLAQPTGTMCMSGGIVGGSAGTNLCNNNGGTGGNGKAMTPAGNGSPGQPGSGTGAAGGAGQMGTILCSPGTAGVNATAGNPGTPATSLGTLMPAGYAGPTASVGTPGGDGPGGGGGGGAIGCGDDGGVVGGAGGGGGAGGCGGAPGNIGLPGGSSLGLILSANSVPTLTFVEVSITTANGGGGGNGAAGQQGGKGGGAESVTTSACQGGTGGNGGNGGAGPGGAGGHSIAIALTKATLSPAPMGLTVMLGQAGGGGAASDSTAMNGPEGIACKVMSFSGPPKANAPCTVP